MTFLQNGRTNKKNRQSNVWHVGQYVRLSKEDGDKPESDSIQNQQRIISKHIEYMEQQGEQIASVKVYSDDGYAGGSLNRPAFQQMMRAVEAGEINCVIFKDDCVIKARTPQTLENRHFLRIGTEFRAIQRPQRAAYHIETS